MYRFLLRPKWIAFHLLCLVGVIGMLWLCSWQLRRLDERKDFNAEVVARSEQTPVTIDELLAEPDFSPGEATWRRVTAQGVWLPQQVIVFNRSQNGLAGDNVLTALEQDNGTTVLVNRGFVPVGVDPPDLGEGEALVGEFAPTPGLRLADRAEDLHLAARRGRLVDADRYEAPIDEHRRAVVLFEGGEDIVTRQAVL